MKLWLSDVDPRAKLRGVQAIRSIGRMTENGSTLYGATEVWEAVAGGEQKLLIQTDDADEMRKATALLDEGGCRYQLTADAQDPKPLSEADAEEDPDPPADPDDDYLPTVDVCQVASILLAHADGNPSAALSTARSISRVTQDDYWEEVAVYLLVTFPPDPQTLAALLAARQS